MKVHIMHGMNKLTIATRTQMLSMLCEGPSMRRFTRLTNGFSKKFENLAHMVAIYAVHYNFLRIHKTLRVTPAMAASLSETVLDWSTIAEMMDADQPAKKRGSYKKAQTKNSN